MPRPIPEPASPSYGRAATASSTRWSMRSSELVRPVTNTTGISLVFSFDLICWQAEKPDRPGIRQNFGKLLRELGRYADSERELRAALVQTPEDDSRLTISLAETLIAEHQLDEAGLVERLDHNVHVVPGSERNLKITRPGDMQLAEFYLRQEQAEK